MEVRVLMGGGWALELKTFWGPVKWHRADRQEKNVITIFACNGSTIGRGLGPGIKDFFGPCEMASSQ